MFSFNFSVSVFLLRFLVCAYVMVQTDKVMLENFGCGLLELVFIAHLERFVECL